MNSDDATCWRNVRSMYNGCEDEAPSVKVEVAPSSIASCRKRCMKEELGGIGLSKFRQRHRVIK